MVNVKQVPAPARDAHGVAKRLRLAREHGGLSQQQFADAAGYTRRQVIAWEAGDATPPIWAIAAVRQVCGIDPEWVLNGPGLTPLVDAVAPSFDRLPRLRKEVAKMASDVGAELDTKSIDNVAMLIAQETPAAEREAKKQARAMLRALFSQGGQR